jgi:hypothetical protein
MNADIQHIQYVLEDKLTQLPSIIHRAELQDIEYWYYVGKDTAYQEILQMIKSSQKHSE